MAFSIIKRLTVGYNPAQVERTIRTLNDAYNDLQDALINVTQSQFVIPMSDLWCSKEAVEFFRTKFEPAMNTLNTNAYKTFSQIVSVINAAAIKWSQTTGNTNDFTKIDFSAIIKKLDVSMIVDKNGDGDIGVDEIEAMAKTGILLTKTFIKAQAALTKTLVAISLCGFLGKEQTETLKEAVRVINKNIETTIVELVKATKQAITATITAYSAVAKSISNSMNEISGLNTNFGLYSDSNLNSSVVPEATVTPSIETSTTSNSVVTDIFVE